MTYSERSSNSWPAKRSRILNTEHRTLNTTVVGTARLLTCASVLLFLLSSGSSAADLFPHKADIRHATGFEVSYHDTYKVVRVLRPWKGAKVTFTYVLVQEGTARPDGYEDAQTVTVPIRRFVALSSTYIPHVLKIGT